MKEISERWSFFFDFENFKENILEIPAYQHITR